MRFESRTFWLAKDADEPTQYQDAFELDSGLGRAAIADGVSSSIFSGPWARLLTLAAVADPPPLDDATAFQTWIADKRTAWLNGIDTSKLTWYQRPKMADGAMTTWLWLELSPTESNEQGQATRYQLHTYAIGDSCLFHVRNGETLYWFPLQSSTEFGLNPAVVASVDRQLDHLLEFKARSQECLPDDLLVLATDAIALWSIEQGEAGNPVDWSRYWELTDDDWRAEVFALREAKQMRFDDSTLILLRVIAERPAPVIESSESGLLSGENVLAEDTATDEMLASDQPQRVEAAAGAEQTEESAEPAIASTADAIEADAIEADDGLTYDAPVKEVASSREAAAAPDNAAKATKTPENEPPNNDVASEGDGTSTVATPVIP